jgi:hypothetical protein
VEIVTWRILPAGKPQERFPTKNWGETVEVSLPRRGEKPREGAYPGEANPANSPGCAVLEGRKLQESFQDLIDPEGRATVIL